MRNAISWLLVGLIRAYAMLISPWFGPVCRFEPSCSRYAVEAIDEFGVLQGSWLAIRRLGRCHPLGGSGYDPIPKSLTHGS